MTLYDICCLQLTIYDKPVEISDRLLTLWHDYYLDFHQAGLLWCHLLQETVDPSILIVIRHFCGFFTNFLKNINILITLV